MKVKNILLIDDNEVDNYISGYVLTKCNIAENILILKSAKKALEHLSNEKGNFPEIIFLDIHMPEMDGFDFLESYNSFAENDKNKCTIYMLTSSEGSEDIEKIKQYPYVKDHIRKPLTTKIAEILFNS